MGRGTGYTTRLQCAGLCPPGTFSTLGLPSCLTCPVGVFGDASGLTTSASPPPTPASPGCRFGNATFMNCSGVCDAGYMCPDGSTSPRRFSCPPGTYSLAGAAVCSQCPIGTFGDTYNLTSPACSGNCSVAPGRFCGPAATSDSSTPCNPGQYSTGDGRACQPCPAGTSGAGVGLPSAECAGLCPPGTFSTLGLPSCLTCPVGVFGGASGLTTSACSGGCAVAPGSECGPGV